MIGNFALQEDFKISDFELQKMNAVKTAENLLNGLEDLSSAPMIKTASGGVNAASLVNLFIQMLSALNLSVDSSKVNELVGLASQTEGLSKSARMEKAQEKHDELKIVSKSVRDSHYKIDISKDSVEKHGRKLIMVSCFTKDDYLGRYLIKRNFFFRPDRETFADQAYDEIMTKMSALRDRYYSEVMDVSAISTQMKKILDGVVSEIEFDESPTHR